MGDRIVAELEAGIIGGDRRAGDRLPTEEELAVRYATSRAAVREAVQVLKARGLVVSRRGSGSFVAADTGAQPLRDSLSRYAALRNDRQAYLELLDLRLMVEAFCVRRLAENQSAEAIGKVRGSLERMRAAKGNLSRFGEEDIAFHQAMVEGAGHELFSTIYRGLLPDLGRRFARLTYTDALLVKRTLADHEKILASIAEADAAGAEDHLRRHLAWSRKNFERLL